MPAPALTVARRGQQPVHHFGEGVRRPVAQEIFDFLWCGRQPGQVEGCAPQQRQLIGRRGGRDSLLFQFRQDEIVDRTFRPHGVLDGGRRIILHRLKRPERALLSRKFVLAGFFRLDRRGSGLRPQRAQLHPGVDIGNLRVRQLAHGRHLGRALITQHFQQPALFRIVL